MQLSARDLAPGTVFITSQIVRMFVTFCMARPVIDNIW